VFSSTEEQQQTIDKPGETDDTAEKRRGILEHDRSDGDDGAGGGDLRSSGS
jgi:hypothetical protein